MTRPEALDLSADGSGMLGWLAGYSRQLRKLYPEGLRVGRQALETGLPVSSVLVLGTGGGSAAAAHVVAAMVRPTLKVPMAVAQGYELPGYLSAEGCGPGPARGPASPPRDARSTLVVAVSHSGETEETLTAWSLLPAETQRRAVVVSGGGRLASEARYAGTPCVALPTGMQARAVFPGIVAVLLGLLDGLGLTAAGHGGDVDEAAALADELARRWGPTGPGKPEAQDGPTPLSLARVVADRLLLVYGGAGATEGVARRWKNQLAENGKTLAHWYTVPEAHHDEVVGWDAPAAIREHLWACVLRDPPAESPRMARRLDATRRLLGERVPGVTEVAAEGESLLARTLSLCLFGDFLSCYVALLRGVDPTPVPLIAGLKEEIARG